MESLSGMFSKIFLRAAFVFVILGIIARIQNYQVEGKAVLKWFMGISAAALLDFTNTCLLFAIAFALIQLLSKKESKETELNKD